MLISEWITETHWHPRGGQTTDFVPPGFTSLGRDPKHPLFLLFVCECGIEWSAYDYMGYGWTRTPQKPSLFQRLKAWL